jgi:hypothetical protein
LRQILDGVYRLPINRINVDSYYYYDLHSFTKGFPVSRNIEKVLAKRKDSGRPVDI